MPDETTSRAAFEAAPLAGERAVRYAVRRTDNPRVWGTSHFTDRRLAEANANERARGGDNWRVVTLVELRDGEEIAAGRGERQETVAEASTSLTSPANVRGGVNPGLTSAPVPPTQGDSAMLAEAEQHREGAHASAERCALCLNPWPCLPARFAARVRELVELQAIINDDGPLMTDEEHRDIARDAMHALSRHGRMDAQDRGRRA